MALDFQHAYSRFEEGSLLVKLNTHKQLLGAPEQLVSMLRFGIECSNLTEGLFNLTSGAVLATKGYGAQNLGKFVTEWTDKVHLDGSDIYIQEGINIDFGGFGKGWLVDELFEYLVDQTEGDVLVNGGGDMRLSFKEEQKIPLMVPGDSSKLFARIAIAEGAMASSSPLVRAWGKENHLVDASGGSYSGDIAQLTVLAATCAQADAYATALTICKDPFALASKLGVGILAARKDGKYQATPGLSIPG